MIKSSNFDSEMPISAASLSLPIYWSSSIFGRRLLMYALMDSYVKNSELIMLSILKKWSQEFVWEKIGNAKQ